MSDSKDNRDACSPALKSVAGNRAPGFSSLLGLLFIGLKLAGHLDWSWWWVLSPFWIMGGLALVVVVGILIVEKRTGWDLFSGET